MSPRPRFAKLAAEKKEQILEAAADEFGKYGFDAASINKIIERAGISKGAAYYYFDDKEDLYATVLLHAMEMYERWTVGHLGPESLTAEEFWDQWHHMGLKGLRFLRKHPWMARLFRGFFAYSDAHLGEPALEALWKRARQQTMTWLEKGQQLGRMRTDIPMDLFVDLVFGMGLSLDRWIFDNLDDFDDDELEEAVVMMVDMIRRISEPPEERE